MSGKYRQLFIPTAQLHSWRDIFRRSRIVGFFNGRFSTGGTDLPQTKNLYRDLVHV